MLRHTAACFNLHMWVPGGLIGQNSFTVTWISILGPQHTFLDVALSLESCRNAKCLSIFEKTFHPSVCTWSLNNKMLDAVITSWWYMHWFKLVYLLLSPSFVTINKAKVLVLRHAAACFKTPMCSSKNRVLQHAAA